MNNLTTTIFLLAGFIHQTTESQYEWLDKYTKDTCLQGYPCKGRLGRKLMQELIDHVGKEDKLIMGFCSNANRPFYEKTGFQTSLEFTKRLIYLDESGQDSYPDEPIVFWKDNSFELIKRMLSSGQNIYFNRPLTW